MPRQQLAAAVLMTLSLAIGLVSPATGQPASGLAADLVRLIDTQGVSGCEADVRALIRQSLPAWATPQVDEIGNLVVTIGAGRPHTIVAASIDEDGYAVSGITAGGYLRLQRVTSGATYRLFDQFLYGQPVVVRTSSGRLVAGVAGTASTHLLRGTQTAATPRGLDDLWIDVGASSDADVTRLGIRMLDTVSVRERSQPLAGGLVAGVAAQARAGALALVAAVAGIERAPSPAGTLTIAWTAQGVFGDRGLARLLQQHTPDRLVILARAPAGRDAAPDGTVGRLGAGPLVAESDTALADAATLARVAVQTGLAAKPPAVPSTTRVSMLALPVTYAQTPVETVSTDDIAALARLVRAVAALGESPAVSTTGAFVKAPVTPVPAARATLSAAPPATALPARMTAAGVSAGAAASTGRAPSTGAPVTRAVLAPSESALFATLRPLAEAYGVSGREARVRELVAGMLPAWAKPQVDPNGNLTVTFGKGPRALVFVAHTDEIGYEITSILEDGGAAVRKLGGFMDSLMEGHPVLVHTARGMAPAIVAPRADYLRATEWQPGAAQVRLAFGTSSRSQTEALGVAPGDTVTVRKSFTALHAPRATARSIDDRAGCAVLIEALKRIDPAAVTSRVTFAWVVGEETGLVGSRQLAAGMAPEYAFAVDTFVSSDSPLDNQRTSLIPLGSGAVLRGMDGASITPAEVLTRVEALATTHSIPVTIGVTGGGTDSSSFSRVGSIPMPLSWPGRYSHSAVEVVDARDLDALVRLVVVLATVF